MVAGSLPWSTTIANKMPAKSMISYCMRGFSRHCAGFSVFQISGATILFVVGLTFKMEFTIPMLEIGNLKRRAFDKSFLLL